MAVKPAKVPRFGLILFAWAVGGSQLALGDEVKNGDAAAMIFSSPAAASGFGTECPADIRPIGASSSSMSALIAATLPRFDPKPLEGDLDRIDNQTGLQQAEPLVMQPFTVNESRAPELARPKRDLLDAFASRTPLVRMVGRNFTSTLTFVDLGTDSNWRPFSKLPPPALTVRYTLSW